MPTLGRGVAIAPSMTNSRHKASLGLRAFLAGGSGNWRSAAPAFLAGAALADFLAAVTSEEAAAVASAEAAEAADFLAAFITDFLASTLPKWHPAWHLKVVPEQPQEPVQAPLIEQPQEPQVQAPLMLLIAGHL